MVVPPLEETVPGRICMSWPTNRSAPLARDAEVAAFAPLFTPHLQYRVRLNRGHNCGALEIPLPLLHTTMWNCVALSTLVMVSLIASD